MPIKWSVEEALKCLEELRSPFEVVTPQQEQGLPNLAEPIKELAEKNREPLKE